MLSKGLLFSAAVLAAIPHVAVANGGEGGGAAGGVFLVPMEEMIVPIVDGPRASGRLRVKLVLRATDAATVTRLEGEMPALREASFLAASEFARLYASPFTPVDATRLAHDLDASLRSRDHGIATTLLVEVAAIRA